MKTVLRFLQIPEKIPCQIPEKISGTPGSPQAMLEKITMAVLI